MRTSSVGRPRARRRLRVAPRSILTPIIGIRPRFRQRAHAGCPAPRTRAGTSSGHCDRRRGRGRIGGSIDRSGAHLSVERPLGALGASYADEDGPRRGRENDSRRRRRASESGPLGDIGGAGLTHRRRHRRPLEPGGAPRQVCGAEQRVGLSQRPGSVLVDALRPGRHHAGGRHPGRPPTARRHPASGPVTGRSGRRSPHPGDASSSTRVRRSAAVPAARHRSR